MSFHNMELNSMPESSKLHKWTGCTDLVEVLLITNFNKDGEIEELMLFKN